MTTCEHIGVRYLGRSVIHHYSLFLTILATSLSPLPALFAGQPGQNQLKPGDNLPSLAGQALSGTQLDIPSAFGAQPAVVLFSFSRAGGRDAQEWARHLTTDHPHLAIYTVIFLEAVPGLFRSLAVTGIKGEMPAALRDRTILLYRDEELWRQRLRVADEHHASVMLLKPGGKIQWMTSGPFADSLYSGLKQSILAMN